MLVSHGRATKLGKIKWKRNANFPENKENFSGLQYWKVATQNIRKIGRVDALYSARSVGPVYAKIGARMLGSVNAVLYVYALCIQDIASFVLSLKYKPNTNRVKAEVCKMVCISRTKQRVACIILMPILCRNQPLKTHMPDRTIEKWICIRPAGYTMHADLVLHSCTCTELAQYHLVLVVAVGICLGSRTKFIDLCKPSLT